jgi:DNA modification methylase
MEVNRIYIGDSKEVLKTFEDKSVNCIVTSPPYFNLRNYNMAGQMGLEGTPDEYIKSMVELFRECKRVLRDDGNLWLNIGDSYGEGKNLIGIPWRLAFGLQADGWILRQDIIWSKPNPMPESVTDRCTKAHEYIFLLSKSQKYFYDADAIKQPMSASSFERLSQDVSSQKGSDRVPGKTNGNMKAVGKYKNLKEKGQQNHSFHEARANGEEWQSEDGKANKRSVWTVSTKPFSEAHFATFPEELIVDCIKAGCPEGGITLDPFSGAGTTALVAAKLNRNYVGIELNPQYVAIAEKRLRKELGMFYKTA